MLLRARRVQHLLDGVIEPIDVALHAAEERAALLGIGVVAAERVEIQPQRRERRAHLVGDRVEERALALVQAHLAHEPRRERDEPRVSDYPTDAKLEALGVAPHFSLRLCTTDTSINAFKPHPRGFLLACGQWGLDPQEVLYVGDRPEIDGAGAAAAGTRCVIVGRGGAWGAGRTASTRRFADIARAALAG